MSIWPAPGPWLLVGEGVLEVAGVVTLDREESRHLKSSLRRRPGDEVVLNDGAGAVARAEIRSFSAAGAEVEILEMRRVLRAPGDVLTVALSVLHTRAMDWAVQKAVETGARRFTPLITGRCQLDSRACEARRGHWRRVAMQASKQCQRAWFMEITAVRPLDDLVGDHPTASTVVAHREGMAVECLPREEISILVVGPEGGFTESEEGLIDRSGWSRLRLGEHVLRAETAVTVGTAIVVDRNAGLAGGGEKQ